MEDYLIENAEGINKDMLLKLYFKAQEARNVDAMEAASYALSLMEHNIKVLQRLHRAENPGEWKEWLQDADYPEIINEMSQEYANMRPHIHTSTEMAQWLNSWVPKMLDLASDDN